jgi:hypothetical protein
LFSKIIINSPWYYFLLSLAVGAAVTATLYYRNKKNSEAPRQALFSLSILRFLSTFFIALLLLNILLRRVHTETENPVILFAIDNSTSMIANGDSSYIRHEFMNQFQFMQEAVSEKFTIKTLLFGNHTRLSAGGPTFSEKETDMEDLIKTVDNNYANLNLGALVIVSDGIANKGANPVYSAEKLGYPIFAVALGDTSEIKDVGIHKINHNQVAYLGNDFPVEVLINARQFAGKKVAVSISQNGALQGRHELNVNSDAFLGTANFTLNAQKSGVARYEVKATVLEGEKNVANNSQSFVVEVIDNKEKVLLLAASPHPDIAALKEALASTTTYELEYTLAADFKKPVNAYSLLIIHGYSNEMLQLINSCRNNNVPYWIINPATSDNLTGVKITGSMNRYNDAEAVPEGAFGLFSLSEGLRKFIPELPALKIFFGNYATSNGASIMISQRLGNVETGDPILLFADNNGLKSALFLGDGLWRWKMRDFAEHGNHNLFNELISKPVQYLSVKSDKSFFRITTRKIVNENEQVEIDAEVYNKSYELVTGPDVSLVLTNSDNNKFNYTFSKTAHTYKLNIGLLPAGEYRYDAKVTFNNETYTKQGIISVREVVAEKVNTVANHRLLYQLAHRTSGKVYTAKQLLALQKELMANETIKPVTYSESLTTALVELKWLFWLLVLLLCTEWFFRKRFLII